MTYKLQAAHVLSSSDACDIYDALIAGADSNDAAALRCDAMAAEFEAAHPEMPAASTSWAKHAATCRARSEQKRALAERILATQTHTEVSGAYVLGELQGAPKPASKRVG